MCNVDNFGIASGTYENFSDFFCAWIILTILCHVIKNEAITGRTYFSQSQICTESAVPITKYGHIL
jgi:hypothetical protein